MQQEKNIKFAKIKKLAFLLFFVLSLFLISEKVEAAVSATSTPLTTPFPFNKVKENYIFSPIRLNLSRTATDTLAAVEIEISTTTNATPTSLTSSSFNWVAIASSTDDQYDEGDTILATTTAAIGATTTINLPPDIPAEGYFFVVLNTASTSTFTDNGDPDVEGAVTQRFRVSTLSFSSVLNGSTTTYNSPPFTTTTEEFIADTHSQLPATSTLTVVYQGGQYYLQQKESQALGEPGTTTIYVNQTTTTPLVSPISLTQQGALPSPVSLGSQYLSSLWIELKDIMGHATSTRVQYNLPPLPQVTSIKAFQDRIIFGVSTSTFGLTDCTNYTLNGSTLSCQEPTDPFIDFFGGKVTIRNLNLTVGDTISFGISNVFASSNNFPLTYSTSTLLVEQATLPQITSISPNSTTTGATVTISGTNFGTATGTVYFCGGFSPSGPIPPVVGTTTSWSDTQITAIVPSDAKSGPVQVETSDGILSDVKETTFLDILQTAYIKIVNTTTTQPVTTSTNMRIFIGTPNGENIYYVGDSHGTTFDSDNYVYTIPAVSSMGFTWAYDASGTYLPSQGTELLSDTSSSSPQVLVLQGTTTKRVSGTITLGTTCTSDGQNKLVAVMALPEGVEVEM